MLRKAALGPLFAFEGQSFAVWTNFGRSRLCHRENSFAFHVCFLRFFLKAHKSRAIGLFRDGSGAVFDSYPSWPVNCEGKMGQKE
ncbi:hypothetical protein [Falsochrobactrum shanghaiense]|uniref:hypothetical protein n=1 Tax=Falsochrobactrum shanghaiense TaxID=2201899 RepID=UPI0011B1E9B4|nr:hypothetical protein [Falsochrobactrum shanghaiense]